MAHFILEYSDNLSPKEMEVAALLEKLHDCAIASEIFPVAGIRSRAICYRDYRVADGDPSLCFVNLSVRVGAGRSVEVRKQVGEKLFQVLADHFRPVLERRYIGISFEMRELDDNVKFNMNNIHEKLRSRE